MQVQYETSHTLPTVSFLASLLSFFCVCPCLVHPVLRVDSFYVLASGEMLALASVTLLGIGAGVGGRVGGGVGVSIGRGVRVRVGRRVVISDGHR